METFADIMTYKFISDPGHGWLQVPISELYELGLVGDISNYSYRDREYAYLEEDVDAGVFITALKERGINPKFTEVSTNYDSPIRNKARF